MSKTAALLLAACGLVLTVSALGGAPSDVAGPGGNLTVARFDRERIGN
jgi:hypothetical protein